MRDYGKLTDIQNKENMNYNPTTFNSEEERRNYLIDMCEGVLKPEVVDTLIDQGFLTAPASTKYHGNYRGGLFDHSVNVAEALQQLTENNGLQWKDVASPLRVGLLHDLCKIDQYIRVDNPCQHEWVYNKATLIKSHGLKSVIYAQMLTDLNEEEIACIAYHMGAFTPEDEWQDYTNAVNQYPNVLWTHTADMIASHVMNI